MVKLRNLDVMDRKHKIRNVCVLTSSGYEKAVLIESLMGASGVAKEVSPALPQEDFIEAESLNISLQYEMSNNSLKSYKGDKDEDEGEFLINLIEAPGHTDLIAEATDTLCIADGALVVVDCGEELHPKSVFSLALKERIKPIICLRMPDSLDSEVDGEHVYQSLFKTIKKANELIHSFEEKLVDAKFYPEKGTVAFFSDTCCYGFTLRDMASYHSRCFPSDVNLPTEMLWGNNFYDTTTAEWTFRNTGSPTCKRGFVKFCYEPVKEVTEICMTNDKSRLLNALDERGLVLTEDEMKLEGEDLMKCVMNRWLPAGTTLLDMLVAHLPSPAKAQTYRVENLYRGPLNDSYALAIRNCDPNGPPVIYISKMIRGSGKNKSFAFGRIFSGKAETGMKVRVMGPNHVPGEKDYHIENLQAIEIFKGRKRKCTKSVKCGNVIALVGLNKYIPSNATMTKHTALHTFPLRAITTDLKCGPNLADIVLKAVGNSSVNEFRLPYHVYDDLFLHQREGLLWLWSLHCERSGGILADDMGLGKTRQVCAFLRGLRHTGLIKRAVVIAPPSVIDGWESELKDVGIRDSKKYTDARTERNLEQVVMEGGLLRTTYGMFSKVKDTMLGVDVEIWDYVFMDEGHRAKNDKALVAKSLTTMKCIHKIIMTGTPLQNNLMEFHTLMGICKPLLLGDADSFHQKFALPINRGKHRDADPDYKKESTQLASRLTTLTNPFVLRRTKELLKAGGQLKSNKYEYTIWIALTPCQINYYKALVTSDLLRVQGKALAAAKIARDICRHPCLLTQNYSPEASTNEKDDATSWLLKSNLFKKFPPHGLREDDYSISSKLSFTVYLVRKLVIEEGHKVLVFSQSPHMLKILEKSFGRIMDKEKIIRMDGSTRRHNRNKMIMAFQDELRAKSVENSESSGSSNSQSSDLEFSNVCEPDIFLMTTRVGGVGLNLTAASRVIIVDPSENPSEDNQAVDRAYRMGQRQDVIVYRLVTCAAIEEHTYREQILKIETSFGILEEEPRMKSICEKEGLVLSLPPRGFNHSKTHNELCRIYGEKMNIVLSNVNIQHKSVIAASNHSLLFSVKEESQDQKHGGHTHPMVPDSVKQRRKPKEDKKADVLQSITVKLPTEIVTRLKADKWSRLNLLRRATSATLGFAQNVADNTMMIKDSDPQELEKARKLVQNFVEEVKSEKNQVIYIPRNKAWVVIGKNGETLRSLMNESGSFIEVKYPEKGKKDLEGQQVIQIFGNLQKIQKAKELILEKLKKYGVHYTIQEDG